MSDRKRRDAVERKVERLREGGKFRALDLFAGCGGMSLGAFQAGCELVGAVEQDPDAAKTHALNFHDGDEVHGRARDITQTDAHELVLEFRGSKVRPMDAVDLLVGGPPCQAFTRIGRAKLREVNAHPKAFLHDSRSGLYEDYVRFVEDLAPVAVLVENVPDALNYGGLNIFESMAQGLRESGYRCVYGILNAVHYGVPQMRARAFLVGIHDSLGVVPSLPEPTHRHELPVGYKGTSSVALKHAGGLFDSGCLIPTPTSRKDLPDAVTAEDALADLPPLTTHLEDPGKKSPLPLDVEVRIETRERLTDFARMMREWNGPGRTMEVTGHVIRKLPRDYGTFERMEPGDQYPRAHEIAEERFLEHLASMVNPPKRSTDQYLELRAKFVPPYDVSKFPNKWRKMEPDQPARTLMAHLGKDSYSHIHYDSRQARTISVREAARLQSFPDRFRFHGKMNSGFRQIGNAVPPLLARRIIERLTRSTRKAAGKRARANS